MGSEPPALAAAEAQPAAGARTDGAASAASRLSAGARRLLGAPGSFGRSVAVLAGSTTLAQGLVVLASPVLTRMYSPAEFGILAGYISVLSLGMVVASLRYEMAIILPEEDQVAADLLGLAMVLVAGTAVVSGAALWLFGESAAAALGGPQLSPYRWILPLALLGGGIYQVLAAWAIRRGAYGRIAGTRLAQSAAQTALQIGAGWFGAGALGLLVGDVAGRASGGSTLALDLWRRDRRHLRGIRWRGMMEAARRYRQFPLFSSPSTLLNQAGLQLPALLFALLYSPAVAGYFLLAQRVIGMPMTLVGQAIAQVYLGRASQVGRDDPSKIAPLFHRVTTRLFVLGGPGVLLAGLLLPFAFGSVFGASWHVAGDYVRLMTPMLIGQMVVSPVSQITAVLERQNVQLGLDVMRTATLALAIFLPWAMGFDHYGAVGSYSAGMLLTYVVFYVVYRRLVRDASRVPQSEPGQ